MLKIKLTLLSAVLPIMFIIIGICIGFYVDRLFIGVVASLLGFVFGVFLNYICSYRKLFALMLYQTPIPLTLFLLTWWISDTFLNSILALICGIIGLLVGLWLNKELILPYQFYKISKRILALFYLFLSIAMLGIFIGIPVFNVILGVLAGNYLSIRVISYGRTKQQIHKNFVQGSLYTAIMIMILSLISGLSSLVEFDNVAYLFNYYLNITIVLNQFVYLLIIGSILLGIIQFSLTYFTSTTMFSYWNYRKNNNE